MNSVSVRGSGDYSERRRLRLRSVFKITSDLETTGPGARDNNNDDDYNDNNNNNNYNANNINNNTVGFQNVMFVVAA